MPKRYKVNCLVANLSALLTAIVLQACSISPQKVEPSCEAILSSVDTLLLEHVGSLKGERVHNQASLRHNRFIHFFIGNQDLAEPSAPTQSQLIDYMGELAEQGLKAEWKTLDVDMANKWKAEYQVTQPEQTIEQCINELNQQLKGHSRQTAELLATIPKDNDYSATAKVFGLYPLSSKVFASAIEKEQQHLAEDWLAANRSSLSGFTAKQAALYLPEPALANVNATDLQLDAFGQLASKQQQATLLKWYAPQWLIENNTADNVPGVPVWQKQQLAFEHSKPFSFSHITYARHNNQTTIQLNYILWFKQRPKLSSVDWVAGEHDALIFRIHLTNKLEVIAYDSIHLCGCWYTLMLPQQRSYHAIQDNKIESVLMHRVNVADKMRISISADTHQIIDLQPTADIAEVVAKTTYTLQPWQSLLTLEKGQGYKSIYDSNGYVWGSERFERWFFWPMGVKQPGSLRRFGDHAISFVGERYFDQVHLLEDLGVQ
ncbi:MULTISPECIES: hypothetical protein [unclassified Agarivorans]|uniref:hypothetical protein n=1 Tax=unclassified Agarivorans TaxID=2636026 RepID=UPI0026E1E725|nr:MULTISPECIES: hypothetical protein [unclassified Agarivorans]MDO6684776.1 hypothetical protein [Agarivorans sp. 3_MG-2023]MDO6715063.1 hypothetical protein [Agarivorans sp. 2_MG-2023]